MPAHRSTRRAGTNISDIVGGGTTGAAGGTKGAQSAAVRICNPKELVDRVVIPLAQKHKIQISVASVVSANARHGPTKGGNRSDHQGPPNESWAADMSNGGTTTPRYTKYFSQITS